MSSNALRHTRMVRDDAIMPADSTLQTESKNCPDELNYHTRSINRFSTGTMYRSSRVDVKNAQPAFERLADNGQVFR
jgi:hypothetical protein